MSDLRLIRHGQATPFEADTDRLSPLGETQTRAVGAAFQAEGWVPTHVLHGPLVRQRRSAQLAAGQASGWPTPLEDARLAEFDGDGLMGTLAPLLAAQEPGFAAQVAAFRASDAQARNRTFQALLETVAAAWQAGTLTHPDVESWAAFRGRVVSALADTLALPGGSRVAVFTSGGVIGLMLARVLDAPDATALRLNWRVRNASVTRLTFGAGRVSLDSFNGEAHLLPAERSWR